MNTLKTKIDNTDYYIFPHYCLAAGKTIVSANKTIFMNIQDYCIMRYNERKSYKDVFEDVGVNDQSVNGCMQIAERIVNNFVKN